MHADTTTESPCLFCGMPGASTPRTDLGLVIFQGTCGTVQVMSAALGEMLTNKQSPACAMIMTLQEQLYGGSHDGIATP